MRPDRSCSGIQALMNMLDLDGTRPFSRYGRPQYSAIGWAEISQNPRALSRGNVSRTPRQRPGSSDKHSIYLSEVMMATPNRKIQHSSKMDVFSKAEILVGPRFDAWERQASNRSTLAPRSQLSPPGTVGSQVHLVRANGRDCLFSADEDTWSKTMEPDRMVARIWNERTGNEHSIHDRDNTSCRVRHGARPTSRRQEAEYSG